MRTFRSRLAFTLVELLIVVVILMILAGILVPVVREARESARKARCSTNMAGFGRVLLTYAVAHKGALPPLPAPGDSYYDRSGGWPAFFAENDVPPEIAYSPSHVATTGGWVDYTWTTPLADWDDSELPPIYVDNSSTGTPGSTTPEEWVKDDGQGEPVFLTSGMWAEENHAQAENLKAHKLNATLGDGWAKWAFDLGGLEGSGTMQLWVKMRKWPEGHNCVRYKFYGTRNDVINGTPQKTIDVSLYNATETYGWVSLGNVTVEGQNAPYITVENVGPGMTGGGSQTWDGTLGTALNPTPNPAESMVDGVQGAGNFSLSGTWSRSPASGNDPDTTGAVNGFAYGSTTADVSATWTIQIPAGYSTAETGPIELWAYVKEGTDRCTTAKYIVRGRDSDTDATQTAILSQRDANGDGDSVDRGWFKVGEFHFDGGARTIKVQRNSSTETTTLRADAIALKGTLTQPVLNATTVWADAVKLSGDWSGPFVPQPGYFVLEGTWEVISSANQYGPNHQRERRGGATAKAAWYFRVGKRQLYEVFGWWPAKADTRVTDAKFKVFGCTETIELSVNQADEDKNGTWRSLCRTLFDPAVLSRVEIDSSGPGTTRYTVADAIAVVPVKDNTYSRPIIGYLYFGYRADGADGYPSAGIVSGETIIMPASVQELSHPGSVPILADFHAPGSSGWITHKDGVHVLYMDGRVDWVPADETRERWVDTFSNRFRW